MTTDAVGGVWQYAADLAAELARGGCTVSLAVMGPEPDPDERSGIAAIEGVRLIETGLPLDWLCADAAAMAAAAEELARLATAARADLVHCNSPALLGAADFRMPVVAAAHGCIATWWRAARGGPVDTALRWHGEAMRRGLGRADAVIAPSASFAATLQATYALTRLPQVVHNGRPPAPDAAEPPAPAPFALTVGRMWDPVKNGALLDRVAGMIGTTFLAAGATSGPQGESIAFQRLVTLGKVPAAQVRALLAHRPVFVSAASFEPFGLAVLEAAGAGSALVLSDITTFRELWEGAALFAAPDDAEGFAAAITRLHEDPDLRRALGDAAQARAARYTPDATARAVTAIYRRVLAMHEVAA